MEIRFLSHSGKYAAGDVDTLADKKASELIAQGLAEPVIPLKDEDNMFIAPRNRMISKAKVK
jgi:hypothetical protein